MADLTLNQRLLLEIQDTNQAIVYLQRHGLLKLNLQCMCGVQMRMYNMASAKIDKKVFHCPSKNCRKTRSIRADSFFKEQKLSFTKSVFLMFLLLPQTPAERASVLACVQTRSFKIFGNCWNICTWKMRNLNPQLGSTGGIVQIDESLIFQRKSNR